MIFIELATQPGGIIFPNRNEDHILPTIAHKVSGRKVLCIIVKIYWIIINKVSRKKEFYLYFNNINLITCRNNCSKIHSIAALQVILHIHSDVFDRKFCANFLMLVSLNWKTRKITVTSKS